MCPGTRLAITEYSIDSGNKVITDALAEADVLGIFGWQAMDLAAMWNPPQPTDPAAFSFFAIPQLRRPQSRLRQRERASGECRPGHRKCLRRATGNVLTLVLINKSNTPVSVPVAGYSMSMFELPPSAD